MEKSRAAREAWGTLAPSHRKEYARWIADAKKEETRARRVVEAIARLAAGEKTPIRANDAPAVSAAPLAKKLGLKPGQRAVVIDAPAGVAARIEGAAAGGKGDVVLAFARDSKALAAIVKKATAALAEGGSLWVAYPKKTSGIATDLSRDTGWDALKKLGWQGVSLVAVDEQWSAMRFRR
jgi:hypothetical protein